MRTLHIKLIAVLGIMLSLASCGKYEDGPSISLRSKKGRVTSGEWQIDKILFNGIDQKLEESDTELRFSYLRDGNFTLFTPGNYSSGIEGTWEFDEKKEFLLVTIISTNSIISSRILKLENKDMWLETIDDNGDKTETHYVDL